MDGSVCGFWRYLHIRHCEIPAFAGMVYLGTGDLWGIWVWCLRLFGGGFGGDLSLVWANSWICCLWRILGGVAAFVCEIPAFTGMVPG